MAHVTSSGGRRSAPCGSLRHHFTRPFMSMAATLCLLGCALVGRYWAFTRRIRHDVATLLNDARPGPNGSVTAEMLTALPAPLQRYLRYAGVVGTPLVQTVHLTQEGQMHPRADGPWLDLAAEQSYTVRPSGFVWAGTLHRGPLTLARARDQYAQGQGHMLIRAGGLYPIADARGPKMDQGALLRFLQEMTYWFPSALLNDNVVCEAIDDRSARQTLTDGGRSVSGVLSVDVEGRATTFVAQRYRTVEGGYDLDTWSCPVTTYGELAGLRLPVRGMAIWTLPEGDLPYIDLTVTTLEYNPMYNRARSEQRDRPARRR